MTESLAIKKASANKRLRKAEQERMLAEFEARTAELAHVAIDLYYESLSGNEHLNERQKRVVAYLSHTGIPSKAMMEARVTSKQYYQWLANNPEFKLAIEEAKKHAAERLELVAIALATGEVHKPVVNMGKVVTYEPIYDSKLLLALLKSRMPEKYAQRVDITSNGHTIVKLVDKEAWESVIILILFCVLPALIASGLSTMAIAT